MLFVHLNIVQNMDRSVQWQEFYVNTSNKDVKSLSIIISCLCLFPAVLYK